jgi:hypothetical protein
MKLLIKYFPDSNVFHGAIQSPFGQHRKAKLSLLQIPSTTISRQSIKHPMQEVDPNDHRWVRKHYKMPCMERVMFYIEQSKLKASKKERIENLQSKESAFQGKKIIEMDWWRQVQVLGFCGHQESK